MLPVGSAAHAASLTPRKVRSPLFHIHEMPMVMTIMWDEEERTYPSLPERLIQTGLPRVSWMVAFGIIALSGALQ